MYKSEIRDKILEGVLKKEDVDNEDLYDFLELLKLNEKQKKMNNEFKAMTIEDWRTIMKKCKSKSVSSVFSKRTYVVYKIIAYNEKFMYLLLIFYNLYKINCFRILNQNYVLYTLCTFIYRM